MIRYFCTAYKARSLAKRYVSAIADMLRDTLLQTLEFVVIHWWSFIEQSIWRLFGFTLWDDFTRTLKLL